MSEADGRDAAARQALRAWWAERMRPQFEVLARAAAAPEIRPCHCWCAKMHPADPGICEALEAVTTRRFTSPATGPVDVSLCAPCAVAQGLAELAR